MFNQSSPPAIFLLLEILSLFAAISGLMVLKLHKVECKGEKVKELFLTGQVNCIISDIIHIYIDYNVEERLPTECLISLL